MELEESWSMKLNMTINTCVYRYQLRASEREMMRRNKICFKKCKKLLMVIHERK